MREKIGDNPKQIIQNNHKEKHRHELSENRSAEHIHKLNEERWIHDERIMILFFSLIRFRLREKVKTQLNFANQFAIEQAGNESDDCEEHNVSNNTTICEDTHHCLNHGVGNLYESPEGIRDEISYSSNVPRINNATSENCRHRKICKK